MEPNAAMQSSNSNGSNTSLKDPIAVLKMLNKHFPLSAKTGMFCTMVYAVVNTKTGVINWIRAGHEPPLFVHNSGYETTFYSEPGGLFVSQMPILESSMKCGTVRLEKGDRFVLYSDGLTESMKNKEEFGYNRLADVMREYSNQPLSKALKAVVKASSDWSGEDQFVDDVTLLAIERTH
jgi:sigma-B regulation protein RsbU (phosphoserine phosphatase)